MKNDNNKKVLSLAIASLALAAPMAMAQVASGQVEAQTGAANAATQVNAAHHHAAAQTATQTDAKAQVQAATPATPAAPVAKASGEKKNWTELDGNGNGTLSSAEAQEMPSLAKIFVEADVNADGELSQDEYKAWVASNNAARAKAQSDS